MMAEERIELLVSGGKASPGPATAPKLSVYGLNIGEVFKEINDKTKEYVGIKVPIKIIINKQTKEYKIEVGVPPVSSLIKKELGIEKAAPPKDETTVTEPKEETIKPVVEAVKEKKEVTEKFDETEEVKAEIPKEKLILGNLNMNQIVKIAKMKKDEMLGKNLKTAVRQVVGTCVSMYGIQIEGKWPKEILKEIDEGKYDPLFK